MSGTAKDRQVPLYSASELSYEEFCDLMRENRPCRIAGITDGWKARQEWVVRRVGDHPGQVDVDRLELLFGDCTVPVADCQWRSEYGSETKESMTMKDYLSYWRGYRRPVVTEAGGGAWSKIERGRCLYLKDWHMQRDAPDYGAYEVPAYFASDWLNEFWLEGRAGCDDYRFVYIGPQGSWTPLHCDVFGSYSWSANICGQKLWYLLPPGEEERYRDRNTRKLAHDLTDTKDDSADGCCPTADTDRTQRRGPIRVVQNEGEVIFVPSGWHHQVLNVTDTISINHNWFNGFNLHFVAEKLIEAETEVKAELDFMRGDDEFAAQVELVLRAHHGMNRDDFQELLSLIVRNRMKCGGPHSCFDVEQCRQHLLDASLSEEIEHYLSKHL